MLFYEIQILESFKIEPIDKFLTVLKDDEWKNVRAILTTTFTSGKLKSVNITLNNKMIKLLNKLITLLKDV
jgi:hypothetical protein